MGERILVSACLLGVRCRYDGIGKEYPALSGLGKRYELIPVCPEQLGGLPTPRPAAERRGERVVNCAGRDVTEEYARGAEETLTLALRLGCRCAILKERSPSCGRGQIYDGSFTGMLTAGSGVTAELLERGGIRVLGESEAESLLNGD